MLAPVLGVAGTVIGLVWSFRALDGVDPSMKAQQLAEGIHHAMWSTAIGLAFVPFGVALFGFSLFRLLRSRTTW